VFEANTPVWGDTYSIPFAGMRELNAPVLNVGPFGKDAHKKTERLHIQSAFVELPKLLENMVQSVLLKHSLNK
jgi:arginine utilization protein RocB